MPDDESVDEFEHPPSAAVQFLKRLGERPWEIFTILGTVVFVLGWAGILYLVFASGDDTPFGAATGGTENKVYFMLSAGPMVMIASGVLWGVAAISPRSQSA